MTNSFHGGMKSAWLRDQLLEAIASGRWMVGTRLPVERDLASAFGVGLNTVRRAVAALVEDGIVARRQGAGTFVLAVPGTTPRRRLVGVLVPSTAYYYPRVIDGIQNVLREAGFGVVLASSQYDLETEAAELAHLVELGVEGLLLVPNLHLEPDPQKAVDTLADLPVPYVLVERQPPQPAPDDPTPYVVTDHGGGVCAAVRHLRRLGHRRVGHLGRLRTGTADAVADGFRTAADLLAVDVPEGALERRDVWSDEDIDAYLGRCLDAGVGAVFCHGDRDAAALVVLARRRGLSVPTDLAVIAYDDEVAEVGDVPLTAVSPPKSEVGALAAEILLRRLNGAEQLVHRVHLQPRLVVRRSCGA